MIGAEVACGVCKHLVCPACANDWSTCDQPWGRVFRLGTLSRLVDVDASGRFGLVTRWHGAMRLLDLRALRWIESDGLPALMRRKELRPRLASDGRMFQPDWSNISESEQDFRGIGVSGPGALQLLAPVPVPERATGMSLRRDLYWYVTREELVAILNTEEAAVGVVTYEPLPRKVIQCVYVDDARDLLVAASWGEIIVSRIIGEKLEQASYVKTTGDALWVAIAGPYLVAHIRNGPGRGITVWRVDERAPVGAVTLRIEDGVAIAAISRDGRYLAVGMTDQRVTVHGLDDGSVTTFEEHTDDVSLVRFVGDEQLLVTADDDNRVVIRPRTPAGYARPLLDSELT